MYYILEKRLTSISIEVRKEIPHSHLPRPITDKWKHSSKQKISLRDQTILVDNHFKKKPPNFTQEKQTNLILLNSRNLPSPH